MFSLKSIPVRKYEFENPETGKVLHVHSPKLEALQIFTVIFSNTASEPKDMAGITASMLSDNDEGVEITCETVMRWMDADAMAAFCGDFLGWINGVQASDPN